MGRWLAMPPSIGLFLYGWGLELETTHRHTLKIISPPKNPTTYELLQDAKKKTHIQQTTYQRMGKYLAHSEKGSGTCRFLWVALLIKTPSQKRDVIKSFKSNPAVY